jgi:hypothetical protein
MDYVTRDEERGVVTVRLQYPVEHNKEQITAVALRAAVTVQDLEVMDEAKGEVAKSLRLVCELSTSPLSMTAARKIRSADYARIAAVLGDLLGN